MHKVIPHSLFSDFDVELFKAGVHYHLHYKLGSRPIVVDGVSGVYFAVFAPGANAISVIGDFNFWQDGSHKLMVRWDESGIWEGFIPGLEVGTLYKYSIRSHHDAEIREKADPYARCTEMPPKSASVVWQDAYVWADADYMDARPQHNAIEEPAAIYELHLGSWKKQNGYSLSYRELAKPLCEYLLEMNFNQVEFMPITEHPFYPSWGYLSTGYFAPTARFGKPDDLKFLIDSLHQNGIQVILDWVPAHFPSDEYALADFDGTKLYEHPDKGKGYHPDWNSLIFNYERPEVRAFLISSAHYWFSEFHIDGLRVDAVASMLYLDYSREAGEWTPNEFGGREYLAAIDFLKELNKSVYGSFPGVQMIAEESTAFPGVTAPVHDGGLGFGFKWMMGWMNDSLEYFQRDPIHRQHHHNDISRSLTYAYSENYVLPLSHDEVVHGKKSLLSKMPGDEWQRFANLRLLYAYMYGHPGQKLLFMGAEIGQISEWNVNESVEWHLLDRPQHRGIQELVKSLNALYQSEPPLYKLDQKPEGFDWIDYSDTGNSVLAFLRKDEEKWLLCVLNFTPKPLKQYRLGLPPCKALNVILNSDQSSFGGSGLSVGALEIEAVESHGHRQSVCLELPPLGALFLKPTTL